MRSSLLVLGAALVAVSGCSSSDDSASGSSGSTVTPNASFKSDVMPIIADSCALAACHSSKDSNLGIYLTSDPAQVYAELKKSSASGKTAFVVPGSAKTSWLMIKMDGLQNGKGTEMPPEQKLAKVDRDVVRSWIDQGAKDN